MGLKTPALSLNLKNIEATLRSHLKVKRHTGHMPGPYVDGIQEAAQALMNVIRMERQSWRLDELQHWRSEKEKHFEACDHAHAQFGTLDAQFRAADQIYERGVKRYGDEGPLFEDVSHMFTGGDDVAD